MKNPAKVIMLPTNVVDYCCKEGELIKHNSELFIADSDFRDPNNGCYTQQHLYITSDEEIKVGDWFMYMKKDGTGIFPTQFNPSKDTLKSSIDRKIIAATDKSLKGVPQPSQAFIEKYCRVGGIDEVMVEYNNIKHCCGAQGYGQELDDRCPACSKDTPTLKINPDNTINIFPIKDISKELSVFEWLSKNDYLSDDKNVLIEEWIKENL